MKDGISFQQTDAPKDEADNESILIETPETMSNKNFQGVIFEEESTGDEKDDSNNESMSTDMSDKEESVGVKKYQSIGSVSVNNPAYDDESIGNIVTRGISKRLKKRKNKYIMSKIKPSKTSKKSPVVRPAKRWSKVVIPTAKKRSLKKKDMSSSDSEYDVK